MIFFHERCLLATFLIPIETFYLVLKEDQTNFIKQIRGFVDSELMKTCHEQVNSSSQFFQSQLKNHENIPFITITPIGSWCYQALLLSLGKRLLAVALS